MAGQHLPSVATRYGSLELPDVNTDIIGRFLSRYGEWAWDEAGFVASVVPDDARVLDVGAFVGTFGLGLGLRRRLSFVCFVEANPAIARLLEHNVARNAKTQAVVVEGMVAGAGARPRIGRAEDGNLGATSFLLGREGTITSETSSRAVTLADLRAEYGKFDLIKLDAEGMEHEILHSDAEYLSTGETTLWIECNEDRRSLAVAELLLSWNIDLYYFAFPSYNSNNLRNDPDPIFPLAYEAGLLAAPRVQPCLDAELQDHRCILRRVRTVDDLKDALWRTPRWGMAEWANASTDELAALAGRALRGQSFETFLTSDDAAWPEAGETPRQRLEATQQGLLAAEALAFHRLDELAEERERRERVEEELRVAQILVIERLDQLDIEVQRRERVEEGLRNAEALAIERLGLLEEERRQRDRSEADLRSMQALARRHLADFKTERGRSEILEAALARGNARSLARLAEVGAARERADAAEADARSARDAARANMQEAQRREWNASSERAATEDHHRFVLDAARAQVAKAEEHARVAESRVTGFEASTVWRVSAPVRRFVEAHPGLRAVLRRGRSMAATILLRR